MAELVGAFVSRGRAGVTVDFNDLTKPGMYKIQGEGNLNQPNLPAGAYQFGIMLVFTTLNDAESRILQIYVSHRNAVYVRMNNGNPQIASNWTNWSVLSLQKIG